MVNSTQFRGFFPALMQVVGISLQCGPTINLVDIGDVSFQVCISDLSMASSPVRISLLAGLATLGLYAAFQHHRSRVNRRRIHSVTPSPLNAVLQGSTAERRADLPYRPDGLPGARTVETPWGSCRAYEWGDEKGLKVLLIHGISTPCISLRGVALDLVSKGCRVLLYGE